MASAKPPAMLFYVNDWLSSTAVCAMSLDEAAGYFNLICHCWASGDASLPDDDAKLAGLSKLGRKWSRGSGATIRECLAPHPDKPGFLTVERTLAVWRDRKSYVDRCSDAGRKSGETRRGKTKVSSTNLRTRNEQDGEQERQQDAEQDSQQSTEQRREQESNSSFPSSIGILPPPPDGADCAGDGWEVVVVELRLLGMGTADAVLDEARRRGWTVETVRALAAHWQNHREAEGWGIELLRSKLLQGGLCELPVDTILTLKRSGKPVDVRSDWEAQQADRRREQDEQRRLASLAAERLHQERLERLGPRIDAMSIEERQGLLEGDWYLQQVMIRGKDWRGAKLLQVALLAAVERRDEEAGIHVGSEKPGNAEAGNTVRRLVGRALAAGAAGSDSGG